MLVAVVLLVVAPVLGPVVAAGVVVELPPAACHRHRPSFSIYHETSLVVKVEFARLGWMTLFLTVEVPVSPLNFLEIVDELASRLVAGVVVRSRAVLAMIRIRIHRYFAVPSDRS